MTDDDSVRVWLVERTFSDDEQNIVITTYATPDGGRYYRRELALTSFADTGEGTPVARDVSPADLGETESDQREAYATAAQEVAADHDPDDTL
jgi:hypothetical protein